MSSRNDLVRILEEASVYGYSGNEYRSFRHEVAVRYRSAGDEYRRLVPRPLFNGHNHEELRKYDVGLEAHCAIKARAYIRRKIDADQQPKEQRVKQTELFDKEEKIK